MDDFSKWKRGSELEVAELKVELKRLGLATEGKKADLVARLTQHQAGMPAQAPELMPGDEDVAAPSAALPTGEEIPADPDIPGTENGGLVPPEEDAEPLEAHLEQEESHPEPEESPPEPDSRPEPVEAEPQPLPEPMYAPDDQPADPAAQHNGHAPVPQPHHLDDPSPDDQGQEEPPQEPEAGNKEENPDEPMAEAAPTEANEEEAKSQEPEAIPTDLRVVKIMGFVPETGEDEILKFLHDVKVLDVRFYGEGTSREAYVELFNGPGGNFAKAMAHHEDDMDSNYIIVLSSSIKERDAKCPEPQPCPEPKDSGLTLRLTGFPTTANKAHVIHFLQGIDIAPPADLPSSEDEETEEELDLAIPTSIADRILMPAEMGSSRTTNHVYVKVADSEAVAAALCRSGQLSAEACVRVEKAEDVDMAVAACDLDFWRLEKLGSSTDFIERALKPQTSQKRKAESMEPKAESMEPKPVDRQEGDVLKEESPEEPKPETGDLQPKAEEGGEPFAKRIKTEEGGEGRPGSGQPGSEGGSSGREPTTPAPADWQPNKRYFPPPGKSGRFFGIGSKDVAFPWPGDKVPDFWMTNLEKEAITREQRKHQRGALLPRGGGVRGMSRFPGAGPRMESPRPRGAYRGGYTPRFERPPFQSPRGVGPRGEGMEGGPRPPFRRWNDESCIFLVDVPFRTHWKEIKDWFLPLVATRVFIIKMPDGRDTGEVNVEFESPTAAAEAAKKTGQNLGSRRVTIGMGRSPNTPSYGGGPGTGSIPGRNLAQPPYPGGGPPGRGGFHAGYGARGGGHPGGPPGHQAHGYAQPTGHGTYRAATPGQDHQAQQAQWAAQWAQWQQSQAAAASYTQQAAAAQTHQPKQPQPTSNPTPEQQAEWAAKWAEWQRSQPQQTAASTQQSHSQSAQSAPAQAGQGGGGDAQAEYAAKWAEWQRSQGGGGAQQPSQPTPPKGKEGSGDYNAQWQEYYQQYYKYQQQYQQWQAYYGQQGGQQGGQQQAQGQAQSGQGARAQAAGAQAAQSGQAAAAASQYAAGHGSYVPPPPPI